ncbi:sensor histidine kinase [Paenibacillus hemerocallicola]|nr:histidine kinase [Paenibacillus hemerocallicola]
MTMLKRISIRKKLLLLIIVFLFVPMPALGWIWYGVSTSTIEQTAVRYTLELFRQVNRNTDEYFDKMEYITLPYLTHPVIQQYLQTEPNDYYSQFQLAGQLQAELIPTLMFSIHDVYGVSILSDKGLIVQSTSTLGWTDADLRARHERYRRERQTSGQQSQTVIQLNEHGGIPMITVIRPILNQFTYKEAGVLMIDVSLSRLADMMSNLHPGTSGTSWVMNGNGGIVYSPPGSNAPDPEVMSSIAAKLEAGGNYLLRGSGSSKQLVVFQPMAVTGWIAAVDIPLQEAIGSLNAVRNVTLLIGTLLLAIIIFLIGSYFIRISGALLALKRNMHRAENGDFQVRSPEDRNDEIGSLNRSFNNMVTEIERLVEVVHVAQLKEKDFLIKQKESMLRTMQAQINPHFLYNTLEIINSHGIVHNIPEIVRTSKALTRILRYSLNQSEQVVPLRVEWEHALNYLDIQTQRYPDLRIVTDVDPDSASRVQGIKLTVQPLIENAFIHGYQKHKLRPSALRLSGTPLDEAYKLVLEDEGGGMTEEVKARYDWLFRQSLTEDVWANDPEIAGHIGLLNVHYRIRLCFGPGFGLRIAKSDKTGTVIEMLLPYAGDDETIR